MPDNPKLREVYVTLRLGSEDLDPEDVTQRLGIMPSHAHRRGDLHGGVKRLPYREGQWSLTSEGQPIPRDLEDHIAWILDQIEPVREQFMELHTSARLADIFCYLQCYGEGGPELSPEVMGRLGALQLRVGLDIYFADDEHAA